MSSPKAVAKSDDVPVRASRPVKAAAKKGKGKGKSADLDDIDEYYEYEEGEEGDDETYDDEDDEELDDDDSDVASTITALTATAAVAMSAHKHGVSGPVILAITVGVVAVSVAAYMSYKAYAKVQALQLEMQLMKTDADGKEAEGLSAEEAAAISRSELKKLLEEPARTAAVAPTAPVAPVASSTAPVAVSVADAGTQTDDVVMADTEDKSTQTDSGLSDMEFQQASQQEQQELQQEVTQQAGVEDSQNRSVFIATQSASEKAAETKPRKRKLDKLSDKTVVVEDKAGSTATPNNA